MFAQVETLEEILNNSKDEKRLEEYDEKLQTSFDEIDRLQKQSKDQEAWTQKLQKEGKFAKKLLLNIYDRSFPMLSSCHWSD